MFLSSRILHKIEFMPFNQVGAISSIKWQSSEISRQVPYLSSSILSTKNNINISIGKAWTAIDRYENLISLINFSKL